MLEKVLFPLLLAEQFSELRGKTRFQKLIFLVQKEAQRHKIESSQFDFTIYLHGPFSFELNDTIDSLVNDGFLNMYIAQTQRGYNLHVYRLTPKGRMTIKKALKKQILKSSQARIMANIAGDFGNMQLDELVNEAYRQYGVIRKR